MKIITAIGNEFYTLLQWAAYEASEKLELRLTIAFVLGNSLRPLATAYYSVLDYTGIKTKTQLSMWLDV